MALTESSAIDAAIATCTTLALLKATDGNGESTLDEDDIWSRGKDSSSVGDISIGQRYSMRGNELAATSGTV